MKKVSLVLCLALVVLFASNVFAGTSVDFWVTMAGSDVPIHQATIGGIGSTVTLSVWYSTDVPYYSSVTTLFGWDTATTKGTSAVPLDDKLAGSLAFNIQGRYDHLDRTQICQTTRRRPFNRRYDKTVWLIYKFLFSSRPI